MVYLAIGLMSGSSLDGLDIAYVELIETAGKWEFQLQSAESIPYSEEWKTKLKNAAQMPISEFLELHTAYGRLLGTEVNKFIEKHDLYHKVHFITSHGHTAYHNPQAQTSFQLGDGASIAATTGIKVISDLRNKDVAFGGQGAPIVPIAEQILWKDYQLCLNIGGIANITINKDSLIAFDICPANQVLNYFAQAQGMAYDQDGAIAASGNVDATVLASLNALEYYQQSAPKSLANSYSQKLIEKLNDLSIEDALATASEHIAVQISAQIAKYGSAGDRLLITGGGAFNKHLVDLIQAKNPNIEIEEAEADIIEYKEAIAMTLIGGLRWMEKENVISSVTGAQKSSIGGALWLNEY